MLSEEEKKAIELTKTIIEFAGDSYIPKENRKALQILLNLIEKQQKEIEELKDTRSIFNMGRRSYKNEIESKIKEIIEGDYTDLEIILVLQSLLKEE